MRVEPRRTRRTRPTALTLVDLADRAEVRRALADRAEDPAARRGGVRRSLRRAGGGAGSRRRRHSQPTSGGRPIAPLRRAASDRRAAPAAGEAREAESPRGDEPGYSAEALLRAKPFEECTRIGSRRDGAAAAERLALRLATRRSRRLVPTRGRGRMDPRRSFRDAIATDGELLRLARRARAVEEPRSSSSLCDTSGSMDPHTRFLLAFLLALKKVAPQTEIFAFNTALTRLTPWVSAGKDPRDARAAGRRRAGLVGRDADRREPGRLRRALPRRARGQPDDRADRQRRPRSRGHCSALRGHARDPASRARRVIWLNPLLGDPRYEPTARGMEAALPYVDVLAPAHDLESLERLLPLLAA